MNDAVHTGPDLLLRVQQLNGRFPSPESEKFSIRAAADKLLAEYRAVAQPAAELTLAVVHLLRHLRKYADALSVLQQRTHTPGAMAREFLFLELALNFACRNEAEARRLLAQLEATGKLRPSWLRLITKMRSQFGRPAARRGIRELERAMLQGVPDLDVHLPAMQARYPGGNTALDLLVFVRDRMRVLHGIAEPTDVSGVAAFDKYHRARMIFACGFSWSGSGAVSCFLQQHQEVSLPFGMSELGYVQGKAGRDGLFALLRKVPSSLKLMKQEVADRLIHGVFTLAAEGNNGPLKECIASPGGRAGVLGRLLDDFIRHMLSHEALNDLEARSRILGRFLECLLSINGGSTVLLNNVLMASKLELLPFMERSKFVVVQRDVRDQFTARRLESSETHKLGLDVESFHDYVGGNRAKFELARAEAVRRGADHKMLFIKFEDFIGDAQLRMRVLDFLELDPAGLVPDLKRFDPSVSAKNIGIHRLEAAPEEVAYLEREMGVYLPQEAGVVNAP